MPSLNDIPDKLLNPEWQMDFLHWLSGLNIDEPVARQFMAMWSAHTGRTFDGEDWDFIVRQLENRRGF